MNITAKELHWSHHGKTVTIETKRWGTHTGVITKIFRYRDAPIGLMLDNLKHVPIEHPDTPITIQEGQ